ncbi:YdaS family helix-turn-helix protein [Acinetobacter sp. HR7]|uniref:YdaS family helix-turn-helix protein n=1 Tax=Acinetobacter sp. HR7 TaxID=1509403 RepID=UPI0005517D65|nr:YdaS family helix-turn-helix protein [Acinetobacter sp. HR7]
MSSAQTVDLKNYLSQLAPNERKAFAKRCKTSLGYLNQIMYGNSKCSASLAIKIDKESGGQVKCDSLCPEADFEYIRNQALSLSA